MLLHLWDFAALFLGTAANSVLVNLLPPGRVSTQLQTQTCRAGYNAELEPWRHLCSIAEWDVGWGAAKLKSWILKQKSVFREKPGVVSTFPVTWPQRKNPCCRGGQAPLIREKALGVYDCTMFKVEKKWQVFNNSIPGRRRRRRIKASGWILVDYCSVLFKL